MSYYFNSVASMRETYARNGASEALASRLESLASTAKREGEMRLASLILECAAAIRAEIA